MAATGTALMVLIVVRVLVSVEFNPTAFIRFGEETEQRGYAEGLLADVLSAPREGHDGKFFFSQALDPFYQEPDVHAVQLDYPRYRAQRMLYPTLAGGFGSLSPIATAWGLLAVNIAAIALGTWATARAARQLGVSSWLGLAFPLNPGILMELDIDGAGILALALLMLAVIWIEDEREALGFLAAAGSALTREVMLLPALGLAAFHLYRTRRPTPWAFVPILSVAGWWAFLRVKFPGDESSQMNSAFDLPLRGVVEALRSWLQRPDGGLDLVVGCLVLSLSILTVVSALRKPGTLAWSIAFLAPLSLVLGENVWQRYFDSARALAPVVTGGSLLLVARLTEIRPRRSPEPAR